MSALNTFFSAKSVAVIGASNHRQKVGHQILRNLIQAQAYAPTRAQRKLYPINPSSESILGHKVYKNITEIEAAVHLVIIVTPAASVAGLVDEIIERNKKFAPTKRVKSVMIISAGFAEGGVKGRDLQHIIATKLQLAHIQLLGPNTLGLLHPLEKVNASFAQQGIPEGNLAIISQSGAMLTALFNALHNRNVGVSFAVSLGNKAGITENDCLEYALQDPHTDVIILYLESFAHLPRFFELTSTISKQKPILLLKGGVSERGQKASASHTAALATNQVLLEAAASQMGFTLVQNIEELLNTAFFLSQHHHLPENVMVITNAGGPGVNTIDELSSREVALAQWDSTSTKDFENLLPRILPANPLDLLGDAQPQDFRHALQIAQHDLHVESILVIITPQAVTNIPGTVETLIAHRGKKPLFVALIGGDNLEKYRQELRAHNIFCTAYPNDLVEILKLIKKIKANHYTKETFFLSDPHTPKYPLQLYPDKMIRRHPMPTIAQAFHLLKESSFKVPRFAVIRKENFYQLIQMKYPVFAKTGNLSILHKKKVGAVYGIAKNVDEGEKAYRQLKKFGSDVLFQQLLDIEFELLLGVENDPQFGLYMTIGMGGSQTNILADRAYLFLPASKQQMKKTWQTTKAYQVILAQAENPKEVSEWIIQAMQNLQKMVMKHPWIATTEINPLAINKKGVWAADIKITTQ